LRLIIFDLKFAHLFVHAHKSASSGAFVFSILCMAHEIGESSSPIAIETASCLSDCSEVITAQSACAAFFANAKSQPKPLAARIHPRSDSGGVAVHRC
jgi:hypothetical protein